MMYDALSTDYDRFVNWPARLAYEMPFITGQLQALAGGVSQPLRLLDAACGTGMHVVELARLGYTAAGADLSARMIERAKANARAASVEPRFIVAGFGGLAAAFGLPGGPPFDALLCLGNSLPHALAASERGRALADFAACLRPGGLLVIQNRNFDAVLTRRERWMEPQSHREGEQEWLFLRFYDFEPDGQLAFHVITLHRLGGGGWEQRVDTTPLYPLPQNELLAGLQGAGFEQVACFGSMSGEVYDPRTSGNLVVTARLIGSSARSAPDGQCD